jgi:hypothetical protein
MLQQPLTEESVAEIQFSLAKVKISALGTQPLHLLQLLLSQTHSASNAFTGFAITTSAMRCHKSFAKAGLWPEVLALQQRNERQLRSQPSNQS